MGTRELSRTTEMLASSFHDFFKPWNEWFDGGRPWNRVLNVPAVNITEQKGGYQVALAAPGLKKEDFKIDVEGNMLAIRNETAEKKEDKGEKYTRKEYSYFSFSRSFTLPEEIDREKIEAKYEDGVLKIMLPCRQEVKNPIAKQINVK